MGGSFNGTIDGKEQQLSVNSLPSIKMTSTLNTPLQVDVQHWASDPQLSITSMQHHYKHVWLSLHVPQYFKEIWQRTFFLLSRQPPPPSGPWPPHSRGLYYHKQRRATVGRTLLDEGSARRRDLYLHNNHNRQTSLPPVGFEPTVSAGERPQTCSLDHMATGSRDKGYC